MIQIIPAILATSPEDYKRDIEKLNNSESFKEEGWVHIDFMDNKFVPNKSVDPEVINQYPTHLKKEAHLMVEHSIDWISKLIELGADRILIHYESEEKSASDKPWENEILSNLDFIEDHGLHVRDEGVESGLAVKLDTPLEDLAIYLDHVDTVLLMGIEPGFQGRKFEDKTLDRIKNLAKMRKQKDLNFLIGVDGGVNADTIKSIADAGADYVICGSAIIKGDPDENIEKLWEAINQ